MNESQKGTTLTAEEREELERLEKAATPGPWAPAAHGSPQERWWTVAKSEGMPRQVARITSSFEHDARLIAAMRNALPALLSAARRVEELREAVPLVVGGAGTLSVPAIDLIENTAQQLTAANARADAAEKALRAIADGDAGHSGAFEWPEFYESIREFARDALIAAKVPR